MRMTVKFKIALIVPVIATVFTAFFAYAQTAEQNTAARFLKAGAEQLKKKDFATARDSFEQAIRYDDTAPVAHLGLGITYFHLGEDRLAERELQRSLELRPGEAAAYQVLGDLFYRKDDLEAAITYWEKAVELNPSDSVSLARLERIRREHKAEKDFNREVTSHFLIKYEGREKIEAGRIVLRILEDAYGDIGRPLSYYPSQEIQVILYSSQQFQEVTDAPGWSGGVYDGKIRLPIGGIEAETPGLRKLLYHEYTHAVVRAITPRVPTWLNEGLAQYFEGREITAPQREALKRIAGAGLLPGLPSLEGSFMGLGGNQAAHAYLFSLSVVRYMVDQYGMYRIKTVLEELAAGAGINKAVSSGIMISYEELDRGWRRSLE